MEHSTNALFVYNLEHNGTITNNDTAFKSVVNRWHRLLTTEVIALLHKIIGPNRPYSRWRINSGTGNVVVARTPSDASSKLWVHFRWRSGK